MDLLKDSTARPWYTNEMDGYAAISNRISPEVGREGQRVICRMGNSKPCPPRDAEYDANAALIVRAVNRYSELMAGYQTILDRLATQPIQDDELAKLCRAMLAKAGA